MDKSQIKAELAAIQNELRLSMDSLRLATFKFTLILDRYQMGQFGLGGTPPARGIAQALVQQPAAFRPATPPSGGYSQGQQLVSPLSPLRPVSPLHPFTPPSGGFSPAQRSLSPVRPVTPPPCGSGGNGQPQQQPGVQVPPGPAPCDIGSFEIIGEDEVEESVDVMLASAIICDAKGCRPYQPSGRRC